jgi:hypothetical protein
MSLKRIWKNNGLSIVFVLLFIIFLVAQSFTGLIEYNKEQKEKGQPEIGYGEYLTSGHFLQATFENWESEFLQMGLFIVLAVSLKQKGSSESKPVDEEDEVDKEPNPKKKDAPWPVRKGGIWLKLYSNSLAIAFFLFFLLSFILHFYGSWKDYNHQAKISGEPTCSIIGYLGHNRFWFESFQNWQSEFLSVAAIVVFTIFLRQKGSPQSKPVDATDSEGK